MATTYQDTNVNQLVINKCTKSEFDAMSTHSETELFLVEEAIDDTPTENSTNPVSSGGVYEALQNINYNNPIVFSEASTKQNIESGDTIAEAFGKLQKWNNTPLRDNWAYIATLSSSTSSKQTQSFTVHRAGFFQLIIQGTAIAVNAVARINYPQDNYYNGTSACSATMLNGFGVGNMCYLLPGTYTLEIDKTSNTVVTCNVICMNDNSVV